MLEKSPFCCVSAYFLYSINNYIIVFMMMMMYDISRSLVNYICRTKTAKQK
jgi:hypothetical protein